MQRIKGYKNDNNEKRQFKVFFIFIIFCDITEQMFQLTKLVVTQWNVVKKCINSANWFKTLPQIIPTWSENVFGFQIHKFCTLVEFLSWYFKSKFLTKLQQNFLAYSHPYSCTTNRISSLSIQALSRWLEAVFVEALTFVSLY